MADPLAALRLPAQPLDPDPAFAQALRERLVRALARPEGSSMPSTTPALDVPVGVVPYLAVSDGRAALAWYADALGAAESGERYEMPDGSIGHAALEVHGAVFYLAEGYPEQGVLPPRPGDPVPTSLVLTVPDTDEATARAVDAGAVLERAPGDNPYGRNAVVRDPYGHRWMLQEPAPAAAGAGSDDGAVAQPGDLAYAALWTPDVERAAAFYTAVLDWQVTPGSVPEGRQVTNTTLSTGLWGGQEEQTLFCCWQVDDVNAAAQRVRDAGGTAEPARDEPYGRIADCTDPWGLAFAVFAPPPDAAPGVRTPQHGSREGDLTYLTLEVRDREAALTFYSAVLGWRVVGDSDPADVHPMLGITGASAQRAVPAWRVDDIEAGVERVRLAGGTATEPDRRPYGVVADCTDDQGTRFYLIGYPGEG
ncbi:VOC family protein [soil metagenome]